MALDRRAAVAALLEDRGELLVVSGLGSPTYDVHAAGDSDANFYLWGAMGSAALIGLGLAQARPDGKILAITGDGEQLMGLGGLATIGVAKPKNLSIVVVDNGHFGETGMQRSHTGCALAAAAGRRVPQESLPRPSRAAGQLSNRSLIRRTAGAFPGTRIGV